MARPVKLYNHAVAPNPRRVRIFAAEKGIANRTRRQAMRSSFAHDSPTGRHPRGHRANLTSLTHH
jgi:glutathione S-transferase